MTDMDFAQQDPSFWINASDGLRGLFDRGLKPLQLAKGQALFDQGDFDDRLYVLDEGVLEVSVLSAAGRRLSLNQLRAGSVFGEIAIFDPGPRTARIEALTACDLRAIRQPALQAEVLKAPELAIELLRLAGQRMRWLSRQVEDQVFLTPSARLAAQLLYLAGEGDGIGMSQARLADYVGVTREVVSKTLGEWRRAGVVEVGRGRITLCDRDTLEEIRDADLF